MVGIHSEIYHCWANWGTLIYDSVTHCVPHDNVDIVIKRSVDVLWGIQVEKVTEMVVEIHSCGVHKQTVRLTNHTQLFLGCLYTVYVSRGLRRVTRSPIKSLDSANNRHAQDPWIRNHVWAWGTHKSPRMFVYVTVAGAAGQLSVLHCSHLPPTFHPPSCRLSTYCKWLARRV